MEKEIIIAIKNPPICWLRHKMRTEKPCKKCVKLKFYEKDS